MITVEELIIQSLYHKLVLVNVRRTPTTTPTGGKIDALGKHHADSDKKKSRNRDRDCQATRTNAGTGNSFSGRAVVARLTLGSSVALQKLPTELATFTLSRAHLLSPGRSFPVWWCSFKLWPGEL